MAKKWIEIKNGSKTTYKLVDDDYVEEENFECKDISVNGGCLSFGLTQEEYDRIFSKKELDK